MKAQPLFARHGRQPILTAAHWPYPAHTVFNPGAVRLGDGSTLLLCRVEDHSGRCHLTAARSRNGLDRWTIDPEPTFLPDPQGHPEERWGIEDPRITFLPELGQYAVAYTAYSRAGPGVSLALTGDFRSFQRMGLAMLPDNKDAALLDLEDPGRCLLRGRTWLFGPETEYEMLGDVGQVTFPCGTTTADDGDTLNLYYGAADTSIALATASIRRLLEWLEEHGEEAE